MRRHVGENLREDERKGAEEITEAGVTEAKLGNSSGERKERMDGKARVSPSNRKGRERKGQDDITIPASGPLILQGKVENALKCGTQTSFLYATLSPRG